LIYIVQNTQVLFDLYYIMLYYTALYCIVLYYAILCYS